ncbi:MAG TPA: hypothetical protein VEB40_02275 [Flavipsychrobacter sp.]|nr:hypothetical protein [Flavipsychrobacter sp.]
MYWRSPKQNYIKESVLVDPPGLRASAYFLLLLLVAALILLATWSIRYPVMVKAKASITGISASGAVSVEIHTNDTDWSRVASGQRAQFNFNEGGRSIKGTLQHVRLESPGVLNGEVQFDKKGSLQAQYKAGMTADALIVVKDMRLIQCVFNRSATTAK